MQRGWVPGLLAAGGPGLLGAIWRRQGLRGTQAVPCFPMLWGSRVSPFLKFP